MFSSLLFLFQGQQVQRPIHSRKMVMGLLKFVTLFTFVVFLFDCYAYLVRLPCQCRWKLNIVMRVMPLVPAPALPGVVPLTGSNLIPHLLLSRQRRWFVCHQTYYFLCPKITRVTASTFAQTWVFPASGLHVIRFNFTVWLAIAFSVSIEYI